jgi:hypothetical protein
LENLLVERIERRRRGLTRGRPRRSAYQRKEGRDGGNSEIEREGEEKGPKTMLQTELYSRRGSRWTRKFGAAGSFNSRPFNSGSDFKLEFNGKLT